MSRTAVGLFSLGVCLTLAVTASAADSITLDRQTETINKRIAEGWAKAGIKRPADKATDLEFMRRAFIDLIGRIPSYEEAMDFDQDHGANKRARLIHRLLYAKEYKPKVNGNTVKLDGKKELSLSYTDEFAEHWANIWTVWLLTRTGHPLYREQMRVWMEQELGANLESTVTPYNQLVSKLLTARGKSNENGAVNFIIHHLGEPTPAEKQAETGKFDAVPITSRVTRLFLGIQTNCTQCHDHPFNKEWVQADFWGVNAFFRQTVRDKTPTSETDRQMMANPVQVALADETTYNTQSIIFYERRDGKLMATKPNFLKDLSKAESGEADSKVMVKGEKSRRDALADYVLKHDNFSKAFINRVWGHLFGRGLNKEASIDDFGSHNEVVHPELLADLGKEFQDYKYDMKKLLFWACCSDAYGLSHVANKEYIDQKFEPYFARMPLKALSPEVLFDAIRTAAKSDESADGDTRKKQREQWMSKLVRNFGDDEGNEMTFNGTVVQALLMMNGKELNDEVGRKTATNPVARVVARHGGKSGVVNASAVIDELFMSTLTRHPTSAEQTKLKGIMEKGAVIAGEAPKADSKPTTTAKPAETPKTKPAETPKGKPPGKMPMQATIPSGPRAVPGTGPNDVSFYQDLFWALLNTNEFMLNH